MTEKNTIAIWCEKKDGARETGVEFHVNLWHFSSKERSDFFELGIMPEDPNDLDCIKIFLPIPLSRNEVQDLGPSFQSIELAQGIFNEPLSCRISSNGKIVELREEDSVYCQVYIFSADDGVIDESELTFKSQGSGTLLTITRQALNSLGSESELPQHGYFRLRIMPKDPTQATFLTIIRPKDRAWTSGFDVIEYIDCRMNEARTLPDWVEAAFRSAEHGVANTKLIAFLAVVPVVSSVTSSHTEWHKSRLLERRIWETYVPQGLEDGMVVYHWKKNFPQSKEKRFSSFSAFVKMQTRKSGRAIILTYLTMAFILGVLGSLSGSILFQYFLIDANEQADCRVENVPNSCASELSPDS
jgi:hypothetical protein